MNADLQQHLLQHIAREWTHLPDTFRPWGVWIACFDPLAPAAESILHQRIEPPLRRVWFLDQQGLRPRDPWEFVRFWVVQVQRPWFAGMHGPGGQRFEMGLAAFAPYERGNEIYLETQWGGWSGAGRRVVVDAQGHVHTTHDLWRS